MSFNTILQKTPEWLGGAVVAALIGLLSFGGKALLEWRAERRADRAAAVARLQELSSLLDAGYRLFRLQNDQAVRLSEMLERKYPDEAKSTVGYEETFVRFYDRFSPEEKELHGIIRSITQYSMRPVNQSITEWLKEDVVFRTGSNPSRQRDQLAEKLAILEVHLRLWEAKYQYWILNEPKHALVYLADEKEHGVGFPTGLDDLVKITLRELKQRWSLSELPALRPKRQQEAAKSSG